ncbi:ABC transporter permease [Bacillus marinisedimentorum]|uniref:ABC transporter permease n=1 Tax=Bacillus marinisedimentorum TaxID=1821260 RepID=UPI0008731679|nr:ABC transporter permease [Bacillus marinisedimentorum]
MIGNLILKDMKRIIRDKKTLLIILLMPFVLTAILGFSIGKFMDAPAGNIDIKLGVVMEADKEADIERFQHKIADSLPGAMVLLSDQRLPEQMDLYSQFKNAVLENRQVREFLQYEELSAEEAEAMLKDGELTAVVTFPEHFYYKSLLQFVTGDGEQVDIRFEKRSESGFGGMIAEDLVKRFTDGLADAAAAKNAYLATAAEIDASEAGFAGLPFFMEEVLQSKTVIELTEERVPAREPLDGFQYYAAAMSVMFMLFTAGAVSQSFLEEKKNFTLQRMIAGGAGLHRIAAGTFLSGAVLAALQLSVLIIGTKIAFGIEWGAWGQVVILVLLMSLSVGGFSMILAGLNFKNDNGKATAFFENAGIQVMALIGGSFIPISQLPEAMAIAGKWTPNGMGLQAFMKTMQGYPLSDLYMYLAGFAASAGVLFLAGSLVFYVHARKGDMT